MSFPIPVVYGSSWSISVLQSSHTYISINVIQPKSVTCKAKKTGRKNIKELDGRKRVRDTPNSTNEYSEEYQSRSSTIIIITF